MAGVLAATVGATPIVINDGDDGHSTTGSWDGLTTGPYYDADVEWTNVGDNTSTWAFSGLANDTYVVYVLWPSRDNRTPDAVYTISDGLGSVSVDQRVDPAKDTQIMDNQSEDRWFQKLGSVTVNDGTVNVELGFGSGSDGEKDYILADAVALIPEKTGSIKQDYGAVGDGITDDTQAFRDAFRDGGLTELYLDPGTYLVGEMAVNEMVEGEMVVVCPGLYVPTGLTISGAEDTSEIIVKDGSVRLFSVGNNVTLSDFSIEGGDCSSIPIDKKKDHGIISGGWKNGLTVSSVTIHTTEVCGIWMANSSDIEITDCIFLDVFLGISFPNTSDVLVDNNTCINAESHGFQFWGGSHKNLEQNCRNIIFSNNRMFDAGGAPIWGAGGINITMEGNYVDGARDVGLDLEFCRNSKIINNFTRRTQNAGISLFYGCEDVVITNNVVWNDREDYYGGHTEGDVGWAFYPTGILLTMHSGVYANFKHSNVLIDNNIVLVWPGDNRRRGIWVGSAKENVEVKNNVVSDGDLWFCGWGGNGRFPEPVRLFYDDNEDERGVEYLGGGDNPTGNEPPTVEEWYLNYATSAANPSVSWGQTLGRHAFKVSDLMELTRISVEMWGASGTGTMKVKEGRDVSAPVEEPYVLFASAVAVTSANDPRIKWGQTPGKHTFRVVKPMKLSSIWVEMWGASGTGTMNVYSGIGTLGTLLATSTITAINGDNIWGFDGVELEPGEYTAEYYTDQQDSWGLPLITPDHPSSSSLAVGYCLYGSNDKANNIFVVTGEIQNPYLWSDDFETLLFWSSYGVQFLGFEREMDVVHSGEQSVKLTFGTENWPELYRDVDYFGNGADWSDARGAYIWVYRTSDWRQGLNFSFANNGQYEMHPGSVAYISERDTVLNQWTRVFLPFGEWERDNITQFKIGGNNDLHGGIEVYFDDFEVEVPAQLAESTASAGNGLTSWGFNDVYLAPGWYTAEFSTSQGTWGLPLITPDMLSRSTLASGYCMDSTDQAVRNFSVAAKSCANEIDFYIWRDEFETQGNWSTDSSQKLSLLRETGVVHDGEMSMKLTFGSGNWPVCRRVVNNADLSEAKGLHLWVYRTEPLAGNILFSFANNGTYELGGGVSVAEIANENTTLNEWTEVFLPFGDLQRENVTEFVFWGDNYYLEETELYFDDLGVAGVVRD